MSYPRLPPVFERLLVGLFVLALAVPPLATLAGAVRQDTTEENREPAPPPPVPRDWTSLAAWPEAFTDYFADHLAFRSTLVRWQARFRVQVLGVSPTADVILGEDGWLFYGTDGAVQDYVGAEPFSRAELEAWRATLQHTQDWLDARGIAYLFVVAPDKHAIYPEQMPDELRRLGATSRVDQLMADLRDHSTVRALDLRPGLAAARADGPLFHRTDTHWNDLGAFVAYRQVMEQLHVPGVPPPWAREQFELRRVARPGLDLARLLGLSSVLVEDDQQLAPRQPRAARVVEPADAAPGLMYARVVTEQPAALPRALVFRDSFGSALIPFLSEHFSRAVYVWQNDVDPDMVDAERPQVVIQEWVGRHLHTVTPYDWVAAAALSRSAPAHPGSPAGGAVPRLQAPATSW